MAERTVKIGLAGFGTVGAGVAKIILENADTITARHFNDQVASLNKLMAFLGQGRRIKDISTLDLQNYKRKLQTQYGSGHRQNLHISNLKTLFHWAKKNILR